MNFKGWFVVTFLFCTFFRGLTIHAAESDVELRSIYARNYSLKQLLLPANRASVFIFVKPNCPAVDLIAERLRELKDQYQPRQIAFYAVYSYSGTHIREMAAHAQRMNISLRAFLDVGQNLAKHWGVRRTAVAVVVDREGRVLYNGAVLDGDRAGQDRGFFLKEAVDQFLAGRPVTVAPTPGQGCVINMRAPVYPKNLTFYRDILPLFQAKCQRCHRPGEVAPMSLLTYDDVVNYAPTIAQVVEDRVMPPWPAMTHLRVKENAGLSNEEVAKILGWIDDDTPEGRRADAPPAIQWPDPEQWQIGQPDMQFSSRSYTVPASGTVPYIYTRRPINATEDVFLEALEVKPGARKVVHHIAIHEFPYSDRPITAADLLRIYGLEISNNILGAFVPGIQPRILPPGHAIRIKKGMGVLIDAHYTPYGQEETDVTRLGIKIRRTPPEHEVFSRWFYRSRGRFLIPAGADHHSMVRDDISFENDIEILGFRPHMHARGKSFLVEKVNFTRVEAAQPLPLLSVPRWDFNWQYDYMLETPLRLSGGEAIRMTGVWDNTEFNPTNPNPRQAAQFGEQTEDEMMGLLLIWRNAAGPRREPRR